MSRKHAAPELAAVGARAASSASGTAATLIRVRKPLSQHPGSRPEPAPLPRDADGRDALAVAFAREHQTCAIVRPALGPAVAVDDAAHGAPQRRRGGRPRGAGSARLGAHRAHLPGEKRPGTPAGHLHALQDPLRPLHRLHPDRDMGAGAKNCDFFTAVLVCCCRCVPALRRGSACACVEHLLCSTPHARAAFAPPSPLAVRLTPSGAGVGPGRVQRPFQPGAAQELQR